MIRFILIFTFFSSNILLTHGQSASEVLEKSIQYHDPEGQWHTFSGTLEINMETPDSPDRHSLVTIDLPNDFFGMNVTKGGNKTYRKVENGACLNKLNGKSDFSEEEKKQFRLSCDQTFKYKNYYTYLYGLPMKLKDPGTILHPEVETEDFFGTKYYKLKVTYAEPVGTDTWYFYINPETYAMEAYQFYHDEAKGDGEYIFLTGEIQYKNMRIPKVRKWYTNLDDKFLGTDDLLSVR